MRRNVSVLLVIFFWIFPCAALHAESSLDFGLGYQYFDYKEDLNPPLKSTEKGWVPSTYVDYTFRLKPFLYTRGHFDAAGGDVTFDGSTQGGAPVNFTDSRQTFLKLEWDVGYTYRMRENFQLIPYIGYGYRYWRRGSAKITSSFRSYEEDYAWSYLPVGLRAEYGISSKWSISATAAMNIMFNGRMKARLSQVVAGANDPEFDLGNKVGFYAELPVSYKVARNWAIVATPWYEYSQIGQSNTVNVTQNNSVVGFAFEPASRTHQYGFRLGANLSF